MDFPNRRRFARLNLPMLYRPAGMLGPRRRATNVSAGGVRVLTDVALDVGSRLEIEIFLPAGDSITVDVRVVWLRECERPEADARYEAGLEFLAMDGVHRELLELCLTEHGGT